MIERVELRDVQQDGSGYVVVYLDDGHSYGLNVEGAPVDLDEAELDRWILQYCEARLPVRPRPLGMKDKLDRLKGRTILKQRS